jgi:hypothetical protein
MSFIFALTGVVFSLSATPRWFRATLIAMPFLAIWLDIASWWFTKWAPLFAYTVIGGGADGALAGRPDPDPLVRNVGPGRCDRGGRGGVNILTLNSVSK